MSAVSVGVPIPMQRGNASAWEKVRIQSIRRHGPRGALSNNQAPAPSDNIHRRNSELKSIAASPPAASYRVLFRSLDASSLTTTSALRCSRSRSELAAALTAITLLVQI